MDYQSALREHVHLDEYVCPLSDFFETFLRATTSTGRFAIQGVGDVLEDTVLCSGEHSIGSTTFLHGHQDFGFLGQIVDGVDQRLLNRRRYV